MVPGGLEVTLEPNLSCLVLDHQVLKKLELTVVFDQIWLFLRGFWLLVVLKLDCQAPNPQRQVEGLSLDSQQLSCIPGAVD